MTVVKVKLKNICPVFISEDVRKTSGVWAELYSKERRQDFGRKK